MNRKWGRRFWVLLILGMLGFIWLLWNKGDADIDTWLAKTSPIRGRDGGENSRTVGSRQIRSRFSKPLKEQSCPRNQFVTGIDADGNIKCEVIDTSLLSPAVLEQTCYGHGLIEDGFCQCDEGWSGPHCGQRKMPRNEDAPPDNDFDNVPAPLDCDDNDDLVYPGAPDAVDGKDNDCDGEIDEGY